MNAMEPTETESFDAAELGAMMREMRENLGHDLESVASDLRIRLVYIEAIEAGRLSDLPDNAYVSGFLRAYSNFLGLDGAEIVRRFKMAGAEISTQTHLHLPSPVEEGRLPTASILLVAAVIAAAAYGGWYYLSFADKNPIETVAKLPRELSNLVDGARNQSAPTSAVPQPSDVPPPTSVLSPPPVTVPSVTAQAEKPAAAADTMNEATSAEPAADGDNQPVVQSDAAVAAAGAAASEAAGISPNGATEAPAVSAIPAAEIRTAAVTPPERQNPSAPVTQATATERPTGGVRIVVRATADSYVAVRTGDNEPLFSQLMRPGDSYEVPSGVDLLLETGNAGGLQITIDGKRVPPLGPVGEIRRNIPLDAEKLLRGLN
jgi:cytoskeleton protein RodZ